MMHVVAAFPPTYRQPAAEVANEYADQSVGDKVVGDAYMPCIVGSEHNLML